jgi:hypothetical protein
LTDEIPAAASNTAASKTLNTAASKTLNTAASKTLNTAALFQLDNENEVSASHAQAHIRSVGVSSMMHGRKSEGVYRIDASAFRNQIPDAEVICQCSGATR